MTEKIYIQNDDEKIELSGSALTEFLAVQEEIKNAELAKETQVIAKAAARQAVLDRLGLTEEEAQLILGGSN